MGEKSWAWNQSQLPLNEAKKRIKTWNRFQLRPRGDVSITNHLNRDTKKNLPENLHSIMLRRTRLTLILPEVIIISADDWFSVGRDEIGDLDEPRQYLGRDGLPNLGLKTNYLARKS